MSVTNNDATKVTAGKPMTGGAIFVAPLGTSLPASVSASLAAAFENVGYISDSGVVNSNSPTSTAIKAWGGDTVLDIQTEKPDTFKFTLIEAKNATALKFVYGDSNVTGTLSTGLTIEANSTEQVSRSLVIDMLLSNNTAKRIVLPNCKVTAVGDITYSDGAAVGYETTISAYPDSNGNTHYEYIKETTTSN